MNKYMNKEKIKEILIVINKYLLYIGIILISTGLGSTYQAQHDTIALNESLYKIATTNGILTDGNSYYYIGLYDTNFSNVSYSSNDLLNRSQCKSLYGI